METTSPTFSNQVPEGKEKEKDAIWVFGHVTEDRLVHARRLGGAAAFGAQAGLALDLLVHLHTAAPLDFDLLSPWMQHPHLHCSIQPAPCPTIFELDYSGPIRTITLKHRAQSLARPKQAPSAIPPRLIYLAPVIGECNAELLEWAASCGPVVLGLQGWLRKAGPKGVLQPDLDPMLSSTAPLHKQIVAIVFSELDHPQAHMLAHNLCMRGALVALTRGSQGATLWLPHSKKNITFDVPAAPAKEADPTGAGDVFGIVLGLALQAGLGPKAAAHHAAYAAARTVEGPQMGTLPKHAQDLRRSLSGDRPLKNEACI